MSTAVLPFHSRRTGAAFIVPVATFAVAALTVGMVRDLGWDAVWVVAEFVAASVAAGMAAGTARRCSARRRRAWIWLSAAGGSWALGEAWWAVQVVMVGQMVRAPSPAYVGFLLLPPFAAAGLLTHPAARSVRINERVRLMLDAAMITIALFLLAWQFPLAAVLDPHAGSNARTDAIAYPVMDTLLLAIALTLLTLLTHSAKGRSQAHLIWLLVGLLALTGMDNIFLYLAADGSARVTTITDVLWTIGFAAFALIAAAEAGDAAEQVERVAPARVGEIGYSPAHTWMPDALLAASLLIVFVRRITGSRIDRVTIALLAAMALLVYLRQYILLREKHRLLAHINDGRTQLRHLERHDALTGLPNRAGFLELVGAALADATGRPLAVVKLAPAQAGMVDNLDLAEKDTVLAELAARISGCLRVGDYLARVSDTTFAAVLSDGAAAARFAGQVMLTARTPISTEHHRLHVGLMAGIALTSRLDPDASAATLVQQAGIALNSVTGSADGIAVFTRPMMQAQVERQEQRESVTRALRADPPSDLNLLFEPIIELSTGRLAGLSVRASVCISKDSAVAAGQLAALARDSGLGERLDELILRGAVGQFAAWNRRWPGICSLIWVSVSTETLARQEFPDRLCALLAEFGVAPRTLVLEPLAGSDANSDTVKSLQLVRGFGVRVVASDSMDLSEYATVADAVDDSDADYYDISPVLVERCKSDLRARRLVQATTEFAASRHAETSARQVATVEQHMELVRAGCAVARGALYGKLLPAPSTQKLLARIADGTWVTPAAQLAQLRRASLAWEELRPVISGLPIATFACALDGTLVLAEGALLDRLGLDGDNLGRPLVEVVYGDPLSESAQSLQVALRAAFDGESTIRTAQVNGRWLQVYLCPGLDEDGTITGALGVAIDITHRIQAERDLRDSERRLQSIFAAAPVGMAIVTADSHLQEVNPALAAMLGEAPDDLVGRSLRALWHPDNSGESDVLYARYRAGKLPGYRAERAYKHSDGSAVWTRITVGPLSENVAGGNLVAIIEDLRPVKQLEMELRQAQKLEAVGMLAAGIAHEINTPTQYVGDNLNFLGDAFGQIARALSETQRLSRPIDAAASTALTELAAEIDLPWLLNEIPGAVAQSQDGVTRVATIVGAMRNFGHPDGREPTPIDIDAAIRDTAAVSRNEYKYVAEMSLELGGVPAVMGYPSQFHQVMLNLIVNASHAIEQRLAGATERGSIRIRSWADDSTVHVSVADDGCGMSEQVRARIFDPFFTTKAVGRGTGQGLAIVHHVIVEGHHGTIDVDTAPGQGSTFTLHLPVVLDQDGTDATDLPTTRDDS